MKKLLALMLAAALALSLVACGGGGGAGDNNTPSGENGDTTSSIQPNLTVQPEGNSNDNESTIVEFDSPVVILDSDNVTITATSKFEEDNSIYGHIVGYNVTIENGSDKYLMPVITIGSIDNTMLREDENLVFDPNLVAPNTTADAIMFTQVDHGEHISSIDDLHDFSGMWSVYLSDDGVEYGGAAGQITGKTINILP